jgi:hypothetical protein
MLEIDEVTAWMGEPYVINDKISVLQPKIRDVLTFGERQYFSVVSTLCSTSSNMKSQLADSGVDWETIEDFQMFQMLAHSLTKEQTYLVLGDIDLSKFKIFENKETGEPVMVDQDNEIIIDQLVYLRIVEYLRKVHGLTRAYDRTKSKFVHDMAIEMEREEAEMNAKKPYKSFLWPLISSIKARQGYTKQYVLDMQVYELVHEANRLQVIVQSDALLKGSYSGMIDVKKIKNFQEQCNWMRDIETKQHSGQELKEGTY